MMGSPRNPGNVFGDMGAAINRGGRDIIGGVGDIAKGRMDTGLSRMFTGSAAVLTSPLNLSERIGILTTDTKEHMSDAAEAESLQMEKDKLAAYENARKQAIQTRLDSEVALRLRSPGRQQTLLSLRQGVLPSANNVLKGMGR